MEVDIGSEVPSGSW